MLLFVFCFFFSTNNYSASDRNRALVGAHKNNDNSDGAIFVDVWDQVVHPSYDVKSEFSNDFLVARLSGWVRDSISCPYI